MTAASPQAKRHEVAELTYAQREPATVQGPLFDLHRDSKWGSAVGECRFVTLSALNGTLHHATYFLQRVTTSGYQEIPLRFCAATDTNIRLRFGTLSIDGVSPYIGQTPYSTIPTPAWSPVV